MKLIPNYSIDSSPNGNTVVAIRDDSSVKIRLDATYSRKLASFNPQNEVYSVPEAGVTFRRDVPNGEGNPTGQKASANVSFRLPVMSSIEDLETLITDVRAYVNSEELEADILALRLPTCCADVEEED